MVCASDALDGIADRRAAVKSFTVDWKMANIMPGHEAHEIIYRVIGPRDSNRPLQDISDQHQRRRLSLEDNVSRVVPLSDDAEEPTAIYDNQ